MAQGRHIQKVAQVRKELGTWFGFHQVQKKKGKGGGDGEKMREKGMEKNCAKGMMRMEDERKAHFAAASKA